MLKSKMNCCNRGKIVSPFLIYAYAANGMIIGSEFSLYNLIRHGDEYVRLYFSRETLGQYRNVK